MSPAHRADYREAIPGLPNIEVRNQNFEFDSGNQAERFATVPAGVTLKPLDFSIIVGVTRTPSSSSTNKICGLSAIITHFDHWAPFAFPSRGACPHTTHSGGNSRRLREVQASATSIRSDFNIDAVLPCSLAHIPDFHSWSAGYSCFV
jgi:hypothetical protein